VLASDETTNENGTFKYRKNPDVCGVVIDKGSDGGFVQISGGNKATTRVDTGQNDVKDGERFVYVDILSEQTCMLYGEPTVLYVSPVPQHH
jgi:hypothetical protein